MSKFISFLTALVFLVTVSPVTLAYNSSDSSKALKIASAEIETDRQRVIGEVKVCNTEAERMSFILEAKNLTINSLYKRKLSIPGATCRTYELDFTKNFAEMSNTDDEIRFVAKSVRGFTSLNKYNLSEDYIAIVQEGNNEESGCSDEKGEDGMYTPCINDFVYHEPTGLRIKVKSIDYMRTELLVTHVRWGGVKKFRVYKNRSKKIVAGDDNHTKVELSNIVGELSGSFIMKIESLT